MIITNINMVLEHEVVRGSIEFNKQGIVSLADCPSQHPSAYDGEGGWLMPGLIELHTDNLEQYFTPRPKVDWPPFSAMSAHDAQVVGAGITTVLDAVALGDYRGTGDRSKNVDKLIETVVESQKRGVNRADHFLHLRCELPHSTTLGMFERYADVDAIKLVSLMDHAPGQRQFVNVEKYREYYQGKYKFSDAELQHFEQEQVALSEQWSHPNRVAVSERCRDLVIPMASHDDATLEHVNESWELGMAIAEFPTTVDAAVRSHQLGMQVLMGAPNVVRGGSHSGNVAAHQLASMSVLDILSSDYYPASLLNAIFALSSDESNDYDMVKATRLATYNPAQALLLEDRGLIAEGKRADLLLCHLHHGSPYVTHVWRNGRQVF